MTQTPPTPTQLRRMPGSALGCPCTLWNRRARLLIGGACLAMGLGGCVEHTISITSEPPGAVVWVNDVELGRTPLETDFTFYGTYDVRLHLEGYEPLVTSAKAPTPVYDLPGIDLLSEAVPAKIDSHIKWHFALTPLPEQADGADKEALQRSLIDRAKDARSKTADVPAKEPPKP